MMVIIRAMFIHDWMTTFVAVTGISSPVWLPFLESVSTIAALILPILGVALLTIQIFSLIKRGRE